MILLAHIVIALSSVLFALYGLVRPSAKIISSTTYATAATVISGVALALVQNVSITHLCTSGLIVVGFCVSAIYYAKRQLQKVS